MGVDDNQQDSLEDIRAKLYFISTLIRKKQIGNWESFQYLEYLTQILFNPWPERKVRVNESLYSKSGDGQYDIKPIISIKTESRENYEYVILNNPQNGLQKIDREDLISAISSGILKIRKGAKKISGIDLNSIKIQNNGSEVPKENSPKNQTQSESRQLPSFEEK